MRKKTRRKSKERITVGFLIDNLFDKYEEGIWKSVTEAAKFYDINLICYWHCRFNEDIYQLINTKLVDGFIVLTGSFHWKGAEQEIDNFCKQFSSFPIVSVSQSIEGFANILVDNKDGIRQLMAHLITVHHYQKIAFITGPTDSVDAQERFEAYKEELEHYQIPFSPDLVAQGDFERESGTKAIQVFLDRKVDFDSVIAANDSMAIYAIKELQRRGVRVPEDIAVVGFDDIKESFSIIPSLTTVKQLLTEIGLKSVENIVALINGEKVSNITFFPTKLIVRNSCGCMTATALKNQNYSLDKYNYMFQKGSLLSIDSLIDLITNIFEEYDISFPDDNIPREFASNFKNDILNKNDNSTFIYTLERVFQKPDFSNLNASFWYQLITILEKFIEQSCSADQISYLNYVCKSATILIGMLTEHKINSRQLFFEEQYHLLYRLNQNIVSLIDDVEAKRQLDIKLPNLGFNSFYISFIMTLRISNLSYTIILI